MQKKHQFSEIEISYKPNKMNYSKIRHSKDTADIVRELFNKKTLEYREEFICLFLNRKNEPLGYIIAGMGGIHGVVADPKIIFGTALKAGASSIIVAHNHPSGNLKPSTEDISLTKRLIKAGEILELQLIDHIIITQDNYFSFCDEGHLTK